MFNISTCDLRRSTRTVTYVLFGLGLVAILSISSAVCMAQEEAAGPSVSDIRKITTGYRLAAKSITRKEAFVTEALRKYPGAAKTLNVLIGRELQPQIKSYTSDLQREATRVFAARLAKMGRANVQQMQAKVNALRENENLTKEMIEADGLPVLTELGSKLLPSVIEIVGQSKKLTEKREDLLRLGKLWDFTRGAVPGDMGFTQRLAAKEESTVVFSLPMPPAAMKILQANQSLMRNLELEEAKTIAALNETRILLGLMPVLIDLRLTETARDHSAEMERLGYFSHTSPTPGQEHFAQRAQLKGTTANAENIYMNSSPDGRVANQAWFLSPGHHRNMLGNYNRVGVGRSGSYFTEMFGK